MFVCLYLLFKYRQSFLFSLFDWGVGGRAWGKRLLAFPFPHGLTPSHSSLINRLGIIGWFYWCYISPKGDSRLAINKCQTEGETFTRFSPTNILILSAPLFLRSTISIDKYQKWGIWIFYKLFLTHWEKLYKNFISSSAKPILTFIYWYEWLKPSRCTAPLYTMRV